MKKQALRLGVLLAALLLCLAPRGGAFSDVDSSSWYAGAVAEMTEAGLLSGYPDGTFRPGQTISAAELVAIAARAQDLTPGEGQTAHWAAGCLQAALERGWYDWDELPPTGEKFDQPISRQLAVKILMKAFLPGVRGDYSTESAKIKDFAELDGRYYEAVLGAYAAGLVQGDDQGTFRPKSGLSRAEACILIQRAAGKSSLSPTGGTAENPQNTPILPEVPQPAETVRGGVSQNGWLRVEGVQLCNEAGEAVVLRGMSSHGLHWYGQFTGPQAIQNTAAWGANVFRVAMYTGEGGYLHQPEAVKAKAVAAIDAAIANDLYVILDWHILSDGNPRDHQEEAAAFFAEMAERYKDCPAVLYELCNEPNGNVSWSGDVKPYAQSLIQVIRERSPRALVLVGSPTWSQDLHLAAAAPLEEENVLYTLHFYAGTHGQFLRDRLDSVLKQGLPVFVSEWGTSRADGSGGVFPQETETWLTFLAERGISWCNWSLCDKNETSAALRPGTDPDRPWTEADLSESGRLVVPWLASER